MLTRASKRRSPAGTASLPKVTMSPRPVGRSAGVVRFSCSVCASGLSLAASSGSVPLVRELTRASWRSSPAAQCSLRSAACRPSVRCWRRALTSGSGVEAFSNAASRARGPLVRVLPETSSMAVALAAVSLHQGALVCRPSLRSRRLCTPTIRQLEPSTSQMQIRPCAPGARNAKRLRNRSALGCCALRSAACLRPIGHRCWRQYAPSLSVLCVLTNLRIFESAMCLHSGAGD
jgi:hypothetical protein